MAMQTMPMIQTPVRGQFDASAVPPSDHGRNLQAVRYGDGTGFRYRRRPHGLGHLPPSNITNEGTDADD